MSVLRAFFMRMGELVHGKERDRELAAEMASHLEMHVEDNLRRGMAPEEARRQALLRLGGVTQTEESYRERRGVPLLEAVLRDVRFGLRMLRKSPGFTLVALLTLALGIGANTAIFSVVDAVLLRPLPYQEADRIVQVWHAPPAEIFHGATKFSVSPANYLDWRRQNQVFEHIAAYGFDRLNFGGERPEAIAAAQVAPDFFSVLRARPALGRALLEEEDAPGRDHVVVLGDGLWRSRFGGDAGVVGRQIRLNGEMYTVVGVMPAGFKFPEWAEMWTPLAWSDADRAVRAMHDYHAVARLRPGVDVTAAQAEMDVISRRLEQQYPADNKGWGALVVPLREELVGEVRPALLVLFGAVGFVLLIACANVANLGLSRTLARSKEIALRAALGATRGRILQQMLCEGLLLALAGGALGLVVAQFGVALMVAFLGDKLPRAGEIGVNGAVLAFTLAISITTGLAAGLVPAWRLAKADLHDALKRGLGKTDADGGNNRTRSVLVVSEVALSLVLLVGAGLMIRTLWTLGNVHPGFDARGVVSATVQVASEKYARPEQQRAFFERVVERVRSTPGVEASSAVSKLPLSEGGSTQPIAIEGRPVAALSEQPEVAVRVAMPGYPRAMKIPVLRGRDLSAADSQERGPVILVSESMAKRFWPNEDPLGKRLVLSFFPESSREVVGVIGDVKEDGLAAREPVPTLYVPLAQYPRARMTLVVRAALLPGAAIAAINGAVREIDAEQPVLDAMTLEDLVLGSYSHQRFSMQLLAAFAAFALLLAGVGIYSVLAYAVRRRVPEIGIRVALGARNLDILWLVVGHGLRLALGGLLIGTLVALGVTRLLSGLLYGVEPLDPLTFGAVSVVLCGVSLLACYLPARRAMRIDPMVALRTE